MSLNSEGGTKMKKIRFFVCLGLVFGLLGVYKNPEAQVGEAAAVIGVAAAGAVVGGCAHAALTAKPDITPVAPVMEPAPE